MNEIKDLKEMNSEIAYYLEEAYFRLGKRGNESFL